ncbi:unnamed protein product [Blepharisma stoltei]|uniref:GOLD domain-containing protein n=1 Tax=Blepharisma stoltei TaxID=1481888 RepID=A0AAU9JGP2_9CILI|nr:unnamed protein product [Blepharisma stoltei]
MVNKLLIFLFLLFCTSSFEFNLGPSYTQCFGEDMSTGTLLVGEVLIKNKRVDQKFLSVQIMNPSKKQIHTSQNVNRSIFSFTAEEAGAHNICITNGGKESVTISVDVKIGIAAKDYTNIASTKELKETELMVVKVSETSTQIHKELQYIREREEQMRNTNETIYSRVISYSIVTLVFLAAIAIVQILYLKKFFKSKKMI